jgi:hypothetical protein
MNCVIVSEFVWDGGSSRMLRKRRLLVVLGAALIVQSEWYSGCSVLGGPGRD